MLASGDSIQDGTGVTPRVPLEAPLLIATYEKYLAMLAGSGVRGDMTDCSIVCDEIQIIGDENRGRVVEVLLTLLKRACWGQLVALSAVLDTVDASTLASWLDIALVQCSAREKQLVYECFTSSSVHTFNTGERLLGIQSRPRQPQELVSVNSVVRNLISNPGNCPVVIFCMSRDRVYEIASELAGISNAAINSTEPLLPGLLEETSAARELSTYMKKKVAFHTADLREDERRVVEDALSNRQINVVVATSTLAAGVNFPLGAVVFDRWERWDGKRRVHVPIPASEFQNMAGRAGRMGLGHEKGRVVVIEAGNSLRQRAALSYLDPDRVTRLESRLSPNVFSQIALQLVSAGLCTTESEVHAFLLSTLSAFREREANRAGLDHWQLDVTKAIYALQEWGYVL